MRTIAVIIASAPGSPNLERAMMLGRLLEQQGNRVVVCLWQDAVLTAVNGGKGECMPGETWVLDEDLALRGFGSNDLLPGTRPVGYTDLVELWMERSDSVLGAF